MSNKEQHTDNEVYFLGTKKDELPPSPKPSRKWWIIGGAVAVVLVVLVCILLFGKEKQGDYYFEPEVESGVVDVTSNDISDETSGDLEEITSYMERLEETVNDVPMYVYVPNNARLSLEITTQPALADTLSIICMMQAADIRSDNKQIVGDFVLDGKRISRGVAKKGFCAIVGDKVTIGLAEETPLLQETIESSGYFFRQYPLVYRGELIENTLKNKSIRRAIGIRAGKVVMVESRSNESLHDFAQALIDIGVTDAITLVGSATAYGWYSDENGERTEYGNLPDESLENISYIVWRK